MPGFGTSAWQKSTALLSFSKENIWTAASDGDVARVDALMALEGFTPSSQARMVTASIGSLPK